MEQKMVPQYLGQLPEDYETAMSNWISLYPNTPIININGDEVDFVKKAQDLDAILIKIDQALQKGATCFEPTR
jgi:deoxyguanosine kinase